ncbi:hypothetical protein FOA52_008454 [Chlamydomonas sp. UWO 241]|nr:hypothetical protein FOA52_008454 [Chlamydomonas sp. UWO 241]
MDFELIILQAGAERAAAERFALMEERMANFDALLAALPTWKDDLAEKIAEVSRDSRTKTEALAIKADLMDQSMKAEKTTTRERLDTLTALAKAATEARAAVAERVDAQESHLRTLEVTSNVRINELDMASKRHEEGVDANTRHVTELGVKAGMARIDIEALRERTAHLEVGF